MKKIGNTLAVLAVLGTLVAIAREEYRTMCPASCDCGCNEGKPCNCLVDESCPVPPPILRGAIR